jgi:hypothetical protein
MNRSASRVRHGLLTGLTATGLGLACLLVSGCGGDDVGAGLTVPKVEDGGSSTTDVNKGSAKRGGGLLNNIPDAAKKKKK